MSHEKWRKCIAGNRSWLYSSSPVKNNNIQFYRRTAIEWKNLRISSSTPQGLYFGPKMIFIPPPPSENDIFLLSRHVIFHLPSWPFFLDSSLFCIYFTLLLPLFSFSSPFSVLFSLSSFFLHFPTFSFHLFHIFSPKCHRLIFPREGGGVFSNI